MLQKLTDQLRPLLGERTDDFVRSLANHIRVSEGGVAGFFERIRSAGFSDNLDAWIEGRVDQPLSGALALNLFGAGYIDKLAERNGIGLETAYEAAGIGLPVLARVLAPESLPQPEATTETALNTTERPNWIWGLVAVVLTAAITYLAMNWSKSNPLAPQVQGSASNVLPLQGLNATSAEPMRDLEFELHRAGQGFSYRGVVSPLMVADLTETMQRILGKENLSGGLIGESTKPVDWTDSFEALITLLSDPSGDVTFRAVGDSISFSGAVVNQADFEKKARDLFSKGGTTLDFSDLHGPTMVDPIKEPASH